MDALSGILIASFGFNLVAAGILWTVAAIAHSDTVSSVAMIPTLIAVASLVGFVALSRL